MLIKICFMFLFISSCFSADSVMSSKIENDCIFQGKKLYGRVKIVENFADYKVKVVDNFADLHIQVVKNFPSKCGQWKFVQSHPDFTIQLVTSFPDFTIKFVQNFPGRK